MKKIAIGVDDYKEIIEKDYYYVDKTLFIKDIIEDGKKVNIFTRPRRFGKTLNCSMLYYFFNNMESSYKLFTGKEIFKIDNGRYKKYLNKYPVIYVTFKGIKEFKNYNEFIIKLKNEIKELFLYYTFLLESKKLNSYDKEMLLEYLRQDEGKIDITKSIKILSTFLNKHYNKKVYIIIDEYDTPITDAYSKNLYNDVMMVMRSLLGNTFKGNNSLEKGVLTGVLKISGESIFSGMNNYKSYDLTLVEFSNYFGFTHDEVKYILKDYNLEDKYNDVKKWYNGYLFGETEIFNPFSILQFIDNEKHSLLNYWVNVGGTNLLKKEVFNLKSTALINTYNNLLLDGKIENVKLNLNINFNETIKEDDIWTLFMLSGYLKPSHFIKDTSLVTLVIPNKEVKESLENIISNWFNDSFLSSTEEMYKSILTGNLKSFEEIFTNASFRIFSYYDVTENTSEAFYHAFTLGLFIGLKEKYDIKSNRESGNGRYDVCLIPKDKDKYPLYIFEYKKAYVSESIDEKLNEAYKQIDDKKYDIEFKEYNVKKVAIAFKGKEVKIKYS